MGLLDNLFCRIRRLTVVDKLHIVINSFEVFVYRQGQVNQIVHFLIVGFEVCVYDSLLVIKQIIQNILARDSGESGVLFLQLLDVCVFKSVCNMILECLLIHCLCVLVDSMSFSMFKLELVLEGRSGVNWYSGVYPGSGRLVHAMVVRVVDRWLRYDENVPVVSSSLWWRKGQHNDIYELHYFVDSLVVGLSFSYW